MASSLTSAQRQELKDAFDVFDTGRHINKKNHPFFFSWLLSTDGSGKISQKELGNIFKALNMKINDSQLKKLVTEMDTDGSGMHEKN
jgi:Ca2+-binding EF-hand superfamily protein